MANTPISPDVIRNPYIGTNGNWYQWDSTAYDFVDTGIAAQGEGTVVYSGTVITGTSTTPTVYATGIELARVNDRYRNTDSGSASYQNEYKCVTPGDAATAEWIYDGNVKGEDGSGSPSDASPAMNGTTAPGVSADYSRADHVHPSDTSKAGTGLASTSANGLSPQATAPASGLRSVLAIDNGETARTDKALFDATSPSTQAFGDAAAVGTAMTVARIDHKHAMPTAGIANGNAVKIDAADVADDDFARFTANGLEGRSPAEVLADIGAQAKATITENTDAAPALGTIANNTEYRCTHGTPTDAPSMTIATIAANTTEFACNVIYKAEATTPSAPAVTNNSGKTIKYQGDAVIAGTFTPVAGTVYRLGWLWDGIYLNCYIKGVA